MRVGGDEGAKFGFEIGIESAEGNVDFYHAFCLIGYDAGLIHEEQAIFAQIYFLRQGVGLVQFQIGLILV